MNVLLAARMLATTDAAPAAPPTHLDVMAHVGAVAGGDFGGALLVAASSATIRASAARRRSPAGDRV